MPPETIILVHGLWMSGLELGMLRHRLEADHGFQCVPFSYASVTGAMTDHVRGLRELAKQQRCERLHFVGHSLGGLVILKLLESTNDLPPGRAVFLGSPLQGSRAATGMARWPIGRAALGATVCEELLDCGRRRWDGRRDIGVIAGSMSIGLGRLFVNMQEDGDGTVLVEETRLDGAVDHLVMPVTHTGMVFSAAVAQQVARFLLEGRFAKEAA